MFTFDRSIRKPATLAVGSQVRVTSSASDEAGVRVASEITVTQPAKGGAVQPNNVPAEVRRVERDIERQVRRYQIGVRAGAALDAELILIGVQSQIGHFFGPEVYFRPNVEFAWGEVTATFALNPKLIYRLPLSSRQGRWSAYVGGGPGFNLVHQNFTTANGSGTRSTLAIFTAAQTLRLLVGYNF